MLSKMEAVRCMRLQIAELALTRADRTLDGLRHDEALQRQAQSATERRSAVAASQADVQLLRSTTGGRAGISQWTADRHKAKAAVQEAIARVSDATVACEAQGQVCAQARSRWRACRFDVERLKLLVAEAAKAAA
jgi:predicted RNA-binding Zn ribbon-like protein